MTTSGKPVDHMREGRRYRLLRALDHDPYRDTRKIEAPSFCPGCNAVFEHGRWTWGTITVDVREYLCPAWQRIKDRMPAALLTLSGKFMQAHKDEVMNLVRNYEERDGREHPPKRIMGSEQQGEDAVFIFTDARLTDARLAGGIGEALHSAYEGKHEYRYTN